MLHEYLNDWVDGKPAPAKHETCYPDYSCCVPHLKAPKEEREKYKQLWLTGQNDAADDMLSFFITRAMPFMNTRWGQSREK